MPSDTKQSFLSLYLPYLLLCCVVRAGASEASYHIPQRSMLACHAPGQSTALQDVTFPVVTPEVAFTGDTAAEVFSSPGFEDALAAKLLIIEATFLDEDVSLEHAKVAQGLSAQHSSDALCNTH